MPRIVRIQTIRDLSELEKTIRESAERACQNFSTLLRQHLGLDFLRVLKFQQVGLDPLNPERPLNFIEQLNQSFTYLVSLKGTEYLLRNHKASAPFTLNLGAVRGFDIISSDQEVVAETFATVSPDSNDKLKKDIEKVLKAEARHKYVFYFCPVGSRRAATVDGVRTIPMDLWQPGAKP
jgi:hypothetical protein